MKRKDFIKVFGTSVGGFMFMPKFLHALNHSSVDTGDNGILIVVQLSGGNDGLNTIVPYSNPLYYHYRPTIGIKSENLSIINADLGWHPSCKEFAALMDSGNLSVVQNVGYPNPNRSHFRSMEIWQTGSDYNEYISTGWLGRYLDIQCNGMGTTCGIDMSSYDNLALKSGKSSILTIKNPESFEKMMKTMGSIDYEPDENPNLEFVNKLALDALDGHGEIKTALKNAKNNTSYPVSELAQKLQYIARLIKGGLHSKVYYTARGGFDTHSNQIPNQAKFLKEISEATSYFFNDLKNDNLHKDITILVFSEFGRRVKENGSGTDHGTAGPVFIIGGNNKNKIIGKNSDLENLDSNGDIKFEHDFRSVYATLLEQKLKLNPTLIGIKQKSISGIF